MQEQAKTGSRSRSEGNLHSLFAMLAPCSFCSRDVKRYNLFPFHTMYSRKYIHPGAGLYFGLSACHPLTITCAQPFDGMLKILRCSPGQALPGIMNPRVVGFRIVDLVLTCGRCAGAGVAVCLAGATVALVVSIGHKTVLNSTPRPTSLAPCHPAARNPRFLPLHWGRVQLETIPMYNYPNFLNLFTTFMCECCRNGLMWCWCLVLVLMVATNGTTSGVVCWKQRGERINVPLRPSYTNNPVSVAL